jgi:hypothetical protein
MERYSFTLDTETMDYLKELSAQTHINRSKLIRLAVQDFRKARIAAAEANAA